MSRGSRGSLAGSQLQRVSVNGSLGPQPLPLLQSLTMAYTPAYGGGYIQSRMASPKPASMEYQGPIRMTEEDKQARVGICLNSRWHERPNRRQEWKLHQVRAAKRWAMRQASWEVRLAVDRLREAQRTGAGDVEELETAAEAAETKRMDAAEAAEAVRTPWSLTPMGGATPTYGPPSDCSHEWSCLERHHIATWRTCHEAKKAQREALGEMTVAEARQLVEDNSSLKSILKAKAARRERIKRGEGGGQRRQLRAAKKRARGPATSLPKPGLAKKQETAVASAAASLSGGQDDETDQWMQ